MTKNVETQFSSEELESAFEGLQKLGERDMFTITFVKESLSADEVSKIYNEGKPKYEASDYEEIIGVVETKYGLKGWFATDNFPEGIYKLAALNTFPKLLELWQKDENHPLIRRFMALLEKMQTGIAKAYQELQQEEAGKPVIIKNFAFPLDQVAGLAVDFLNKERAKKPLLKEEPVDLTKAEAVPVKTEKTGKEFMLKAKSVLPDEARELQYSDLVGSQVVLFPLVEGRLWTAAGTMAEIKEVGANGEVSCTFESQIRVRENQGFVVLDGRSSAKIERNTSGGVVLVSGESSAEIDEGGGRARILNEASLFVKKSSDLEIVLSGPKCVLFAPASQKESVLNRLKTERKAASTQAFFLPELERPELEKAIEQKESSGQFVYLESLQTGTRLLLAVGENEKEEKAVAVFLITGSEEKGFDLTFIDGKESGTSALTKRLRVKTGYSIDERGLEDALATLIPVESKHKGDALLFLEELFSLPPEERPDEWSYILFRQECLDQAERAKERTELLYLEALERAKALEEQVGELEESLGVERQSGKTQAGKIESLREEVNQKDAEINGLSDKNAKLDQQVKGLQKALEETKKELKAEKEKSVLEKMLGR